MATLLNGWKRQLNLGNFSKSSYSQYRHYLTSRRRFRNASKVRVESSQSSFIVPVKVTGFHGNGDFNKFLCKQMSTASSGEGDDDNLEMDPSEMDDDTIDTTVSVDITDDQSYLRVKLYPNEENEKLKGYLDRLDEAVSIQDVLDIVEEHERNGNEINIKIASQALISILDLQKFLFKITPNFDPEQDYIDKPTFIDKICQHSTFMEKVVKPVIENCSMLEDEPLTASFLCLKKLNFNIRGAECERFTEECLRRKDTLSLPSISRLSVCLRNESLYGNFIMAKFYPLLWRRVGEISDDVEVRLIAIALRNSFRLMSDDMIDRFRAKVDELKSNFSEWDTVTLCKVFLLLILSKNSGRNYKHVFDLIGEELVCRVPNMQLMDLLSLQKFLEQGFIHPYGLVEALVQRIMRVVQEAMSTSCNPRLDLLSSISPYLKTLGQRQEVTRLTKDYLDNHKFEFAHGILINMLRWIRIKDPDVNDTYWKKASELVLKSMEEKHVDKRILKIGRDYLNFCYGVGFTYRNQDFEAAIKKYFYHLIENYRNSKLPALFNPLDNGRMFSILIGIAAWHDPIFMNLEVIKKLDDFSPQFGPIELGLLARGVESVLIHLFNQRRSRPHARNYDRIIEICSILEEQCSRLLLSESETLWYSDLVVIHKVALVTRKVKGDSPITDLTIKKLTECQIDDGRQVKDLAQILLLGGNHYVKANDLMAEFILNNKWKKTSPEVIEKFVIESFNVGWEGDCTNAVMEVCGENLRMNWESLNYVGLLHACLGLCYYRHLPKELIQNIFSVEFLNQLDNELRSAQSVHNYPMRLRRTMMELNRAVCIDMPDVNLPWFHTKFCEDVLAADSNQETYLNSEIRSVLSRIVNDETAVQQNMCSPYYYKLDFLIEFDEKSRPIKKRRRQPSTFFQKFRQNQEEESEVYRKVAVLILQNQSFTKGSRTLKGHFKLRRRHLEILGYEVVEIDPVYWNSMFMSENVVRQNFLESKLYANAMVG